MKKLALLAMIAAACGPKSTFRLTSDDNDRGALQAALQQRQTPAAPTPTNSAHKPRVFVAIGGAQHQLVAYDIAASSVLWTVPTDLKSRVQVGGDFVVELEGKQLVARDQLRGGVRWKVDAPGELVGAAADAERAYATWHTNSGYELVAYDGASGKQLWDAAADGQLGAPSTQAGLVYSPFLSQWLSILDGKSGRQLARVRNSEDQISVVRTTSQDAFYGSKTGVYKLDARSANATRAGGTYAKVTLPPQLDRATYGRDMYDPVQIAYTAADRARVLYTAAASDAGALEFKDHLYAIHYFRYVLGFTTAGTLAWAYSHPRVELVASDHTGAAIVAIAQNGELVALDPQTGGVIGRTQIAVPGQVIGATFDCDGWAPSPGHAEKDQTADALIAIARDRDARFDKIKELALTSLMSQQGDHITKDLLAMLGDSRVPQKIKDQVAEVLVARKDTSGLAALAEQLAIHDDFIAQTETSALGPVAKAIGGLGGQKLDAKQVATALAALRSHLDAPTTQTSDLVLVIDAMASIGGGAERLALASHLLLYHADDDLGADLSWARAIATALYAHGGPGEHELLRQVAADPRTKPQLTQAIAELTAAGGD